MRTFVATAVISTFIALAGWLVVTRPADSGEPTDVRVGPTAAIGIATSCNGDVVFVANGHGIFKSSDGGETWNQVY